MRSHVHRCATCLVVIPHNRVLCFACGAVYDASHEAAQGRELEQDNTPDRRERQRALVQSWITRRRLEVAHVQLLAEELLTAAAKPEQFPKVCSNCGLTHYLASWTQLPLCTSSTSPTGRAHLGGDLLEFRNCTCGSTLAVELETYADRLERAREALAHVETRVGLRRAA